MAKGKTLQKTKPAEELLIKHRGLVKNSEVVIKRKLNVSKKTTQMKLLEYTAHEICDYYIKKIKENGNLNDRITVADLEKIL